jgi:hypothetical protein
MFLSCRTLWRRGNSDCPHFPLRKLREGTSTSGSKSVQSSLIPGECLEVVKQEITFVHEPKRIRSAAVQIFCRRLKEPAVLFALATLLLLVPIGMFTSYTWLLAVPPAAFVVIFLVAIQYVLTSPRNFCGVEVKMSIRDDGIHFSGSDRSGIVGWAGFKEIYLLNKMWAIFVNNSDAVTYIPTDQLEPETLEFMLTRLRENHVKMHGDC